MSNQTCLHVYSLLHKLFEDAVDLFELVARNPVSKKLKPKLVKRESDFLEVESSIKFLSYSKDKQYGLAIWVQLMLGLRVGEVQALKWDAINFQRGTLIVKSNYARKEGVFKDYPKGKKGNTLQKVIVIDIKDN